MRKLHTKSFFSPAQAPSVSDHLSDLHGAAILTVRVRVVRHAKHGRRERLVQSERAVVERDLLIPDAHHVVAALVRGRKTEVEVVENGAPRNAVVPVSDLAATVVDAELSRDVVRADEQVVIRDPAEHVFAEHVLDDTLRGAEVVRTGIVLAPVDERVALALKMARCQPLQSERRDHEREGVVGVVTLQHHRSDRVKGDTALAVEHVAGTGHTLGRVQERRAVGGSELSQQARHPIPPESVVVVFSWEHIGKILPTNFQLKA